MCLDQVVRLNPDQARDVGGDIGKQLGQASWILVVCHAATVEAVVIDRRVEVDSPATQGIQGQWIGDIPVQLHQNMVGHHGDPRYDGFLTLIVRDDHFFGSDIGIGAVGFPDAHAAFHAPIGGLDNFA